MDLRLDIERRKRFAGKERDFKREGGRSPGGSRGPSRERSSEKSGKHHKKSKYVTVSVSPLEVDIVHTSNEKWQRSGYYARGDMMVERDKL